MKKTEQKVIETIRFLAMDAVEKANSGHPGMPMGTAAMAFTLWSKFLKGSATEPKWVDRDRFVLSAGHGSMLQYALLHLFGYEVTLDDIKEFRQWGSITPGHPEYNVTQGVETTTGPLGQGFANAVGMAIAERKLAAEFNSNDFSIVDHFTYTVMGDGCMMEGVSQEAASLAGHLKLGKLVALYDSNHITIDGSTDLAFTENVGNRFEAYGWHVVYVDDGNNVEEIQDAIRSAKQYTTKPSLLVVNTIIGFGSPNKAGKSSSHGSPMGKEEIRLMKEAFGWDPDKDFHVGQDVLNYMKDIIDKREIERFMWEEKFGEYTNMYPDKAKKWIEWHDYEIDELSDVYSGLADIELKKEASRSSGGTVLNYFAKRLENIIGGSADLNGSTKTYLKDFGDFSHENYGGSNIFFGVREHAMASILNGIVLHGGLRAFGATFMTFSDYMKPAIRLSALMEIPVLYVFTHDSIGVGEDGPTHQPIEHVQMLRSIPNLTVFRPADTGETIASWIEALKRSDGPSALILTRQNNEVVNTDFKKAQQGGYILAEEIGKLDLIIIATGSEVGIAMEARKKLTDEGHGVRVVSMPSWEVFDLQEAAYKEKVLPDSVENRMSVEAGITLGWEKYVGRKGIKIGIDHFGASAPAPKLFEAFGFTSKNIIEKAKTLLNVK